MPHSSRPSQGGGQPFGSLPFLLSSRHNRQVRKVLDITYVGVKMLSRKATIMGSEIVQDKDYIESCLRSIEVAAAELREKLGSANLELAGEAEAILDQAIKNVDWILNHKEGANVPF